jgi:hypothetical protein
MKHPIPKSVAAFFLLLLSPLVLFAQGGSSAVKPASADQFAGNFKGSAKLPAGQMDLKLEIKSASGKLSGRLMAEKTEHPFTPTELVDGKLTIKFVSANSPVTLVLQPKDDKLIGEWKSGTQAVPVEFTKVPATTDSSAAESKKPPTEPSAADLLSGEWDAAADAQGQAFPFTLILKVEGEKVTGSSSSQLGNSTISSGTWKDGKLAVILDGGNGQIALIATMVDGKLVGDYDYSGQLSGKWVAAKKKP